MSLPAVSTKELFQSLQQILQQATEKTDPATQFGVKERLSITDWVATAEATRKAAKHATPELVKIEQMELALRHRTKQISEKPATESAEPLLASLQSKYPLFFSNSHLEEFSRKQVDYLSRHYPDFTKRLLAQLATAPDEWASNFIRFCLQAPSQSCYRDKQAIHWIDIFLKYPEIAHLLMKCGIYEQLGLYPENIAIRAEKGVCLKIDLFNGISYVPIKEPLKEYHLRTRAQETQTSSTTLGEIFQEFERSASPDFTVSMNGITHLNPLLLGSKKNKEGAIAFIDAKKWTDYKPSIEVTLPELEKLYGPVKGEPPYGFVLRADRQFANLTQAQSQAFFDFVIRLENGNYRVIAMIPDQSRGIFLRQQKAVFYPLSDQQGKKIIEMVAGDIENYRASHGHGKSSPYINIEPYIDEIFGREFYDFLEYLVDKQEDKQQNPLEYEKIKNQLALAKQSLDPDSFEKFITPLILKLVKLRQIPEIHRLIEISLKTIKFLLQRETDNIPLPTEEDVRSAASDLYGKKKDATIEQSLLALTRLCFTALHPYSVKVSAAERSTTLLGKIFQIAEAIPWKWLRNLITDFLLLILGPLRGYRYQKMDVSSKNQLDRLVQIISALKPSRYLNRPSQLFENYHETALRKRAADITAQLNILASSDRG